jgi:hypothetical protein
MVIKQFCHGWKPFQPVRSKLIFSSHFKYLISKLSNYPVTFVKKKDLRHWTSWKNWLVYGSLLEKRSITIRPQWQLFHVLCGLTCTPWTPMCVNSKWEVPIWTKKEWCSHRPNSVSMLTSGAPFWVGILCFKFSLNPLIFSHMRETDTKMTIVKSWAICKTSIFEQWNWSKYKFCSISKCLKGYSCITLQVTYNCSTFGAIFLYQFLLWKKIWEDWDEI